jgi:hypothetical protein
MVYMGVQAFIERVHDLAKEEKEEQLPVFCFRFLARRKHGSESYVQ